MTIDDNSHHSPLARAINCNAIVVIMKEYEIYAYMVKLCTACITKWDRILFSSHYTNPIKLMAVEGQERQKKLKI